MADRGHFLRFLVGLPFVILGAPLFLLGGFLICVGVSLEEAKWCSLLEVFKR